MTDKSIGWCFLATDVCMPSSEWAAWIQAIGSVLAILAAACIAISQLRAQHQQAILMHRRELLSANLYMAKTMLVLANNSFAVMVSTADKLNDKGAVFKAAQGLIPLDLGELQRINGYLNAVPIHSVPDLLLSPFMSIGSTIRQFHEKVDMVLRLHEGMDVAMFDDFFQTLSEMKTSAAVDCQDFKNHVDSLTKEFDKLI